MNMTLSSSYPPAVEVNGFAAATKAGPGWTAVPALSGEPLDLVGLLNRAHHPGAGAVVLFSGEVRDNNRGRDKGLLETAGRPWVLRIGDKLAQQHLPVVYSINDKQLSAYSAVLPAHQLVIDNGDAEGPLNGLLSVHLAYPDPDLLLLACDM